MIPRRLSRRLALLALALLPASGCARDVASAPPEPLLLDLVAGDGQTGAVGGMAGDPLVVRVHTSAGEPVAHARVTWSASGGGLVMPGQTTTDADGRASGYWLLDARVGAQVATASVERGASAVHFSAVAELVAEPTLERARPLALATYEGSGQVVHPDVVSTPRGWSAQRRHLVITPYPYGRAERENPSVFAGDDGESWAIPAGVVNPVASPRAGGYLSDPDQLWIPESRELWLYYRQVTATDNVILLTRSTDGAHWTPGVEVVRAPNHLVVSPSVVRRGSDDWLMWSVNSGAVGCRAARTTVELRRSADGVVWSAPVTVPLEQAGYSIWHVDVEWVASRHEFWALYNVKTPESCNTPAVYLATSPDGLTWTTYSNPVLSRGAIPAFEDIVYRSSFEYGPVSDLVTFWYSGARWDGGAFVWSAAVERRSRENVFAAIQRPVSALRADVIVPPRRDVPRLDEGTAP